MKALTGSLRVGFTLAVLGLAAQPAQAQRLQGEDLIAALQDGGLVLVMRHAPASLEAARSGGGGGGGFGFGGGGRRGVGGGAPAPEPTEEELEPESRQLLTGMRHAVWTFGIHIDAIYSSPVLRARQHAEEIPFVDIMIVDELGSDAIMTDDEAVDSGWLDAKLAETPMAGANSIIVTHSPNIQAALGLQVAQGETLVVRPGAEPEVIGRVTLRDWSVLAIEHGSEVPPIQY